MAVAAEQHTHYALEQQTQERFVFFDINASIDLLRFDQEVYGHVLPETRQRVMDEELTYVAEGINRPLYTSFEYPEQDGELMYFSKGEWRPYMQMLYNGIVSTKKLAQSDPRKSFLYDMAMDDLSNGYAMHNLKPGETKSWYSPYRDDVAMRYGSDFMDDCGFQSHRRMGFIYRASKQADGTITLESQSVDNSSEPAFAAAMDMANNPDTDMEMLVWAYDKVMQQETGEKHSAGRRNSSGIQEQNAWYAIKQHGDLVGLYLSDIENLALQTNLSRAETERAKRRLTYGFWATLKERLNKTTAHIGLVQQETNYNVAAVAQREAQLRAETAAAYQKSAKSGDVLSGCGGSMRATDDSLEDLSPESAFDKIFGKDKEKDSGEEDEFGALVFKCTEGHTNRRPKHKLIKACQTKPCRPGSVGC